MNRLVILMVGLLAGAQTLAQMEVDRTFLRRYNYGGMQGGLALATTEDGGFVATGQHEGNGSAGGCDIYVYKVDPCGNKIWFRMFGTGSSEGGKSIEPTPDGGYIIGGHGGAGLLLKLDTDGNAEWYHQYSGIDWIFDAIPTLDGGYAALGRSSGAPVVVKVDGAGIVEWSKRYPEFHDMPLSLSQLGDGDFIFVANQVSSGRDVDVARVDDEGNVVWMRRYGGSGFGDYDHTGWGCNALVDEVEGVVYVTSPTAMGSMGGENILVMQLDLDNGQPIWAKAFGSSGQDQSRDMTHTSTGIAIVGNTTGFPQSVDAYPEVLTENMGERDVLMFHIDSDGNFEWGQTYGGSDRDKGIGVRYDEVNQFTISAYTSSGVFGNSDSSMDPLFIRTDSVGRVNCQSVEVVLQSEDVDANPADVTQVQVFNTTASSVGFTVNEIEPNDVYQCQVCYTEPLFEWSTNQVCVGDPVEFYNTTEVGLICFQEWELEGPEVPGGITFPGNADTISYIFEVPGDYTMTLRSTCDSADQYFVIPLFVHEVHLDEVVLSNYNGYEVSCPDSEDGTASGVASGGSSPGSYQWEWTIDGTTLTIDEGDLDGLPAGTLEAVVFDYLGCSDTLVVMLSEPDPMVLEVSALNQYNGYAVSCPPSSDGEVVVDLVAGGVGGYSAHILEEGGVLPLDGLSAGEYLVEVVDGNGCTAHDSVQLVPPPPPTLLLESRLDSCESGNGGIEATHACGVPPCQLLWPESDGEVEWVNALVQRLNGIVGGTYSVTVIDGNGCAMEMNVMVPQTMLPEPRLVVDPQQGCAPGLEVTIEETGQDEVAFRTFDFGDGASASTTGDGALNLRRMTHLYDHPGVYQVLVSVTNEEGCSAEVGHELNVYEGLSLFAPNAFTPDNDGINDGFRVEGAGVERFHLTISDRWGETVFETEDMQRYWNGSPRGDGLSHINDLFIYMVEATGICEDFKRLYGTVMLLR